MISIGHFVKSIHDAILDANQALMKKNEELLHTYFEKTGKDDERLRPRMITIQYPEQTAQGVVMCDVQVPVITLVPLSMAQISEVRLRSNLVVHLDGDHVMVSFPVECSASPSDANGTDVKKVQEPETRTVASLEITLTPHTESAAMRKLVEGYERILRAQIPG